MTITDDCYKRAGVEVGEQLPSYAWPGGYPVFYLCADNGILCSACANSADVREADPDDSQWRVEACDINYDDGGLYCDNCDAQIESAYDDDESEA